MDSNVTSAAKSEWIDFMVRALTKWRPRAVAAGNHVLVALGDCASQTRDKCELEAVMRLYLDEYLGGVPRFSGDDE
jgi:hypothetical protein